MKIGLIGLGIMGKPMARNILKGGYELVVCSRNPSPVGELVAAGASSAATPRELAGQVDTSHQVGAPLPLTASVMEIMQALKVDDLGECDHGAMVRYFEKQAKIELKRPSGN
jgi:3-hydroxyisobutyrate dehydrogenase-like beta-hydroxyacid dehydrogenase